MVSTTLKFSKADIQPPVFVAGSFTEWSPCEMTHEKAEAPGSGYLFSCTVDLKPGRYQYKYRLGHGDWWVLDESAPTGVLIVSFLQIYPFESFELTIL